MNTLAIMVKAKTTDPRQVLGGIEGIVHYELLQTINSVLYRAQINRLNKVIKIDQN